MTAAYGAISSSPFDNVAGHRDTITLVGGTGSWWLRCISIDPDQPGYLGQMWERASGNAVGMGGAVFVAHDRKGTIYMIGADGTLMTLDGASYQVTPGDAFLGGKAQIRVHNAIDAP